MFMYDRNTASKVSTESTTNVGRKRAKTKIYNSRPVQPWWRQAESPVHHFLCLAAFNTTCKKVGI